MILIEKMMQLSIQYNQSPLGHRLNGLNVNELSADEFSEVEALWDRYGVIVISGQNLTPDQQIAFSKRFGPLDRYLLERYNMKSHPHIFVVSNIIENGVPIGLSDAGRYWHSDMWSTPFPPRGSMLYALEVPTDSNGSALGDTHFASTAAAYDALSPDLKSKIEGRYAVYSKNAYLKHREKTAAVSKVNSNIEPVGNLDKEGMVERSANIAEEISHPLIRIHPRTKRKCIYFSEGAIDHIEGISESESNKILEEVRQHILQPQFMYRHSWKVGDIVLWDNCSSIHKATGDFDLPQRRRMHRTTLADPIRT